MIKTANDLMRHIRKCKKEVEASALASTIYCEWKWKNHAYKYKQFVKQWERELKQLMPFKSEAQRRKFASLVKKGEMSKVTFDAWQSETGKAKLPERVKPKKAQVAKPKVKK